MPVPSLQHAPAAEPVPQQPTAESLGWQLRAALPPLRLHSISLYDSAGEVLWLSEGALGPDEHAFVMEALGALGGNSSGSHRESDFGDGRGAVFLAVRSPQSDLVGLVMILADAKALAAGGLAARVLTPPVRTLLHRLAILLRPAQRPEAPQRAEAPQRLEAPQRPEAPPRLEASPRLEGPASSTAGSRTLEIMEWTPPVPMAVPAEAAAAPLAKPRDTEITEEVLALRVVEEVLTFELAEDTAEPRDLTARHTACELEVLELAKLRPGGRTRRFRILPKHPLARAQSVLAPPRELAGWLASHPALRDDPALHFSFAVSATALADDALPAALAECVRATGIAPAQLGFEVAEPACVRDREHAERFVRAVEQMGCFLVLDDFSFDMGALELLRSKALRVVKVDRALIRAALRDKLAQARIVAISQAARVLGLHCAAKHVDAVATQRWLAAAGFDFAEGPLFGAPRPLASLADELAAR